MASGELAVQRHPEVIDLCLTGKGPTAIARVMGVSRQVVSRTLKNPDVQIAIASAILERRQAINALAVSLSTEALELLGEFMRDPDNDKEFRRRCALDILKAAQVGGATVDVNVVQNVQSTRRVEFVVPGDLGSIRALKEAAREARDAKVMDVTEGEG